MWACACSARPRNPSPCSTWDSWRAPPSGRTPGTSTCRRPPRPSTGPAAPPEDKEGTMQGQLGQGRSLGAVLAVVVCALLGAAAPAVAAAPAAGPAFEGLPREVQHEGERGQDLHLIAGYYYGDARRWELIWQANRDAIKNPNRITPGMVLRVPVDRNWKQDLSFADWLKIGGTLRP